jgi:hypothetical protein
LKVLALSGCLRNRIRKVAPQAVAGFFVVAIAEHADRRAGSFFGVVISYAFLALVISPGNAERILGSWRDPHPADSLNQLVAIIARGTVSKAGAIVFALVADGKAESVEQEISSDACCAFIVDQCSAVGFVVVGIGDGGSRGDGGCDGLAGQGRTCARDVTSVAGETVSVALVMALA